MLLKNVEIFMRKRKNIWIENFFVCLFRFMRISGKGGNYALFISVSHQISPLILSEFKQINQSKDFLMVFGESRGYSIDLNSVNIRSEIWRRCLT